jgi:hypothetical protein
MRDYRIWPRTKVADWFHILSDPSREELEEMIKVGQRVTWPKAGHILIYFTAAYGFPQLHIIENRFKLEREITRGRQSVRPRSRDRPVQDAVVQRQVRPSEATPSLQQGPLGVGTSSPPHLAIESDAEAAFAKGSPRFFKRHHHHSSPASPHDKLTSTPTSDHFYKSPDPLASVDGRQRWATTLLDSGSAHSREAGATHGPRVAIASSNHTSTRTPSPSPPAVTSQSPSLFTRLQRRSFASLPSAFSNFRKSDASVQNRVPDDGTWSSDSSSSDYPLDEAGSRLRHSPLPLDLNGGHGRNSSEEHGNADDGLRDDVVVDDDSPPQQDK